MNGTTPGRAVFQGFNSVLVFDTRWPRWDLLSETQRRAFEAGAEAAIDASGLRALVAEMCAYWERISTREDDEYIAECRQRAGIEAGQ